VRGALLYAHSCGRNIVRDRTWAHGRLWERTEAVIFVVGSPRSGTTFMGGALGAQPGAVDLGEVKPIKAAIPRLAGLSEEAAAGELRRILERVRRFGLSLHLRGVEQTPETSFVLAAALRAYPEGRAVRMVRDGRDVVASLLERGWLAGDAAGADDVGQAFGSHVRFWVERERRDEFAHASEATRAAWAWRRYTTAARAVDDRTVEVRYEELAADPAGAATLLAAHLDLEPEPLAQSLARVHGGSVGRWRRHLTSPQLAEVEREAGALLAELGYAE
jgi:hypothetical protein